MTPAEALALAASRRRGPAVPPTFLGFLAWVGVTPSAGQAELARVAFDGQLPHDLELARRIFGDIDFAALPASIRRVVTAVVGGRGGKTYMLIALRLLWGALVRDLSVLAPGEEAFATVVAPNDTLRQQAINYALGAAREKPELRALLRLPKGTKPEDTPATFGIYRPDVDRVVTFQGAVATRGGYGVRGKWHTDLALDECAFFRDATSKVNDRDIYEAGVSRVLPGGQVLLGSTPWAETGLLYEFWRDNYGKPTTSLVAHAPTLLLNDLPTTREVVEMERKRNPENAAREYDARFMTGGTTVLFERASLDAATVEEPFALAPGDIVAAGGDFGFRSDSSALLLVALRGDVLHVFDGLELRPEEGQPLKPSKTVAEFAKTIAGRCTYLVADGHYREAIAEHLDTHGLAYLPAPSQPADTYVRTRMLLRDSRVRVHPLPFRDRLMQQMREVQGKPTSGGGLSIHHPRWATGGHGDLCAALVLALWQASGETVAAPRTPDAARVGAKRARFERFQAEENAPHWRPKGGAADRGPRAFWRRG